MVAGAKIPSRYNHSKKIDGVRMPRRCNPQGKIVGAGRMQAENHVHLKVREVVHMAQLCLDGRMGTSSRYSFVQILCSTLCFCNPAAVNDYIPAL